MAQALGEIDLDQRPPAVLLAILAAIFWMTQHRVIGRVFKVVPALVFCYFVPTALTTVGVLPEASPLYSWVKTIMLPACLLLLVLSLDIPGILRLGPKALAMLLAGTAGVVIGGPLAWVGDLIPPVACIGAGADFRTIMEDPSYILMGFVWMACHIAVLLLVGRLLRAPLFFVAVGSQANIGGAASAPVVASAFHPSLAAVGALLAVAGYVLGTYAGLVCMGLLKWAAGAGG